MLVVTYADMSKYRTAALQAARIGGKGVLVGDNLEFVAKRNNPIPNLKGGVQCLLPSLLEASADSMLPGISEISDAETASAKALSMSL
jgi:hypothetical protein